MRTPALPVPCPLSPNRPLLRTPSGPGTTRAGGLLPPAGAKAGPRGGPCSLHWEPHRLRTDVVGSLLPSSSQVRGVLSVAGTGFRSPELDKDGRQAWHACAAWPVPGAGWAVRPGDSRSGAAAVGQPQPGPERSRECPGGSEAEPGKAPSLAPFKGSASDTGTSLQGQRNRRGLASPRPALLPQRWRDLAWFRERVWLPDAAPARGCEPPTPSQPGSR